MKKNLLLYILLIFLIVVNGFFLFNYIGNSNSKKLEGPQSPGNFIAKELGFNKTQLEQFRENNQMHHETMMSLSEDIRGLKDELFNRLSDANIAEKVVDSITTLIAQREKEKETEVFYHFKSIQEICNEKQKEKFKDMINDAIRLEGLRDQEPPPPEGANGQRRPHPEGPDGHRPPPKN